MRVAIVTESYVPFVNGVAHSVVQVAHFLRELGHEVLVIAPTLPGVLGRRVPPPWSDQDLFVDSRTGVWWLPSVRVPGVGIPWALPTVGMVRVLRDFGPDVVHLASPLGVGAVAAWWARCAGVPVVGVFQTDIPAYTRVYGVGWLYGAAWRWLRRLHNGCELTLAASRAAQKQLVVRGFQRVQVWGRGVDSVRFSPSRRDEALREHLLRGRKILVGYVGRVAPEKELHRLVPLLGHPNIALVIIGGGEPLFDLPALYVGELSGLELARYMASLDVFVHPGSHETFCQTVQEAQACGVPTIAVAAGGPLDLVDATNGRLLAPEDFSCELVDVTISLAARRQQLGASARAGVLERSWENLTRQLCDYYEQARVARLGSRG